MTARALAIGAVALGPCPRIVAAGGQDDVDALLAAVDADMVELRADLFAAPSPEAVVPALRRLRDAGRPVILTARAEREGGRAMPEATRAAIYAAGIAHADAVDVEIASEALARDVVAQARDTDRTVILSAHDFATTPPRDRLLALVDDGFARGADVVKLATTAATPQDLRTLVDVTLAARERGVVTLGMGPFGPLSRVVLPAAGSLLTFAAAGRPTAPGQLPVAELASLLRRLWPAG